MQKIELKPCPFCGGEVEIEASGMDFCEAYSVSCNSCECVCPSTEWFDTEAEAIQAWNTRHERTCEIEAHNAYGPHMEDSIWHLTCGHHSFGNKPNYCEVCGRKVVER